MKINILIYIILLFVFKVNALEVTLTQGSIKPTPIAITDLFSANNSALKIGKNISGVISDNLERSGLFMPIDKSDPIGGVISTNWYTGPDISNERTKVFIYIKDRRLRADALEVSVFRQIKADNGWQDTEVNSETSKLIENSILTKARELRLGSKALD